MFSAKQIDSCTMKTNAMRMKRLILLVVLSAFLVCLAGLFLMFCRVKNGGNAEIRQFFTEASIIVYNREKAPSPIPWPIDEALLRSRPLYIRINRDILGHWPVYYVRTNGYTCAVWKCPTATWDLELKRMSDEFRVWIKDDTAEVVPTPSFSPRGNPNSKPPRLTAEKALAIAEMKTGIRFGGTNVVEDVGDYFKIGFTTMFSLKFSPEPIVYAWVSKSDWTVCGNPVLQVPELTEQDILSEIAPIADKNSACDRQQPPNIYRVADMTIVTLPLKPFVRGWTPCIWIDNVTKKRVCNWNY
jgi:hypothetical protein